MACTSCWFWFTSNERKLNFVELFFLLFLFALEHTFFNAFYKLFSPSLAVNGQIRIASFVSSVYLNVRTVGKFYYLLFRRLDQLLEGPMQLPCTILDVTFPVLDLLEPIWITFFAFFEIFAIQNRISTLIRNLSRSFLMICVCWTTLKARW